jgi:hypothetical protein
MIMALLAKYASGIWGYAAAAVVAAGLSGYAVHRWDASTIAEMKLSAEQKELASVTVAVRQQAIADKITHDQDVKNAVANAPIRTNTVTVIQKVPVYVTKQDDARCVLHNGFVQLLDAAGLGIAPEQLPGQASEPVGADSGISLSQAAALLAQNLGEAAELRQRLHNASDTWDEQAKAMEKK